MSTRRWLLWLSAAIGLSGCETPVHPPHDLPPLNRYLVFFGTNESTITPQARATIGQAVAKFGRDGVRVDITGHTDQSGPAAYNQVLGQRRAEAVLRELVANGVPREKINAGSRGKTQPLVLAKDGTPDPQNRRVEIIVH